MRSKLFVPAIRPELFGKAMASQADAISFDIEDAVPQALKGEARLQLAAFLRDVDVGGKTIIVRVNAMDSPHFQHDIDALAGMPVDLVNLPKVESADEVHHAAAVIGQAFAGTSPPRLLLNIETPKGIRNAAAIADAHARVAGLQLGLGDLFEPLGMDRHDSANVHAVMHAMRMAAAEAGVFAYDGAYANVQDETGFRAEAGMARRLGFLGKSCIHPRQISAANEVFSVTEAEIASARRIVEAAAAATDRGHGAFLVDGRMVDPPYLRRAQAILAAART
ncbi:MAG: CoA ester lyase [Pseudoxanthomonas sp.]